ncbi:MAG: hypothetical protein HRT86_03850 [Ilumatobacteraceae bacterium]|nr:hypothetical protein [Ilumatobacteraceae bacterium]
MTASTRQRGAQLDELAELEEERRFLLRSLDDLEREFAAGDVDDADYQTLKDGYTARAAKVLRQIEAGRSAVEQRPPRRWGRMAAIAAVVVAAAVGMGFILADAWGERRAGQEITGFTPGDDARLLLASARATMTNGDFATANGLFGRVVEMERDQGRESVEAIAYFGWTLALLAIQEPDDDARAAGLDAAVLALGQAAELDPTYPDPQCFLAITEFQFRDDADAALSYVESCEANNPPADVSDIVAEFADEIRAAAG